MCSRLQRAAGAGEELTRHQEDAEAVGTGGDSEPTPDLESNRNEPGDRTEGPQGRGRSGGQKRTETHENGKERNSARSRDDYGLKAEAEETEGKTFPKTLVCTRRCRWNGCTQDIGTALGSY